MSDMLKGKRGLIMGVANERSIAWGIAKAMAEAGSQVLVLERETQFRDRVRGEAWS